MSDSKVLEWMKRHPASSVWLPLLTAIGAFAHFLARWRMEHSGRQFEYMDPITVRHMPLIDTMQAHMGYAVGYAVVFLGVLLWLECREARRWVIWVTFAMMSVPSLDYIWACLALGTRLAIYNPP